MWYLKIVWANGANYCLSCLGMSRRRRPRCSAVLSQHQEFLERMQQTQNLWLEQQREQSHAWDEALLSQQLAESTHSTGIPVDQVLTELSSFLHQPTLQPHSQPMYPPPHEMYQRHSTNPPDNHHGHHPPPHNPYPSMPQSEGNADDCSAPRFCQTL